MPAALSCGFIATRSRRPRPRLASRSPLAVWAAAWLSRARTPAPRSVRPERRLLLGVFQGVPATQQSVFALPTGPARIVLFQDNIEAVCGSEAEIRRQVRLTVIHEIGHYFGMSEEQLRDV